MGFRISKRAESGFVRGREPLHLRRRFANAADAIAWLMAGMDRADRALVLGDIA